MSIFPLILGSLQMTGYPTCSSKTFQKGGLTGFYFLESKSWKIISFLEAKSSLLRKSSLLHRCYKDGLLFLGCLLKFLLWLWQKNIPRSPLSLPWGKIVLQECFIESQTPRTLELRRNIMICESNP